MSLLQIIPLGGAGEIGKNCTAVQMGDDIIVIDCGLSFPHEEQYGVDIVIPDFAFLRENRDKLRGVVLTHAHEDHVGALSFFLYEFDCPIYASPFTEAMIRSKLEERARGIDPDIKRFRPGDKLEIGPFVVEPILVTHSIPETCAMAIHTPHGVVLFTADFKFDFSPVDGRLTDMARLAEIGKEGVLVLLSDSTNVDRPGFGPSESTVTQGLLNEFRSAPGRILVTMFSSNIHRMQQVFDVARETGRKVAIAGRRMETVVQMARSLDYLRVPEGVYLPLSDVGKLPANEVVIIITGSQGEPSAALSQMSRGEYSRLQIVKGDTILYSARPIPGNEGGIWRTVNRLFRMGANVVTDSPMPIHVSGHAYQQELKMMINLVKPFYLAPVHGEPRHQHLYLEMATAMGHAPHRMFTLANGSTLCIDDERAWLGDEVPTGEVLIDQHGDVPVTPHVLAERSNLGHEGVIVVSLTVDDRKGRLESRPEARAHGFSGPDAAIENALEAACDELAGLSPADLKDIARVEKLLIEVFRRVVNRTCRQRPVVIPVISTLG